MPADCIIEKNLPSTSRKLTYWKCLFWIGLCSILTSPTSRHLTPWSVFRRSWRRRPLFFCTSLATWTNTSSRLAYGVMTTELICHAFEYSLSLLWPYIHSILFLFLFYFSRSPGRPCGTFQRLRRFLVWKYLPEEVVQNLQSHCSLP